MAGKKKTATAPPLGAQVAPNNGEAPSDKFSAFVKAWQAAMTTKEVAGVVGMATRSAYNLALRLRKRGVKLKKMARGSRTEAIDVEALNAIIEDGK